MRLPASEEAEKPSTSPTSGKRRFARSVVSMGTMHRDGVGGSGSGDGERLERCTAKLQLQCSDGALFDVSHEEAMMSSTLWMLLQDVSDRHGKTHARQHTIPIFDVPSASVELALYYCRCLYKQQVEGHETAMHDWEDRFYNLDSKTLCDLAKVASNLDIQPLVDVTCRSIAQIMSATEAAHEIRQKFGLEDGPGTIECSCELRSGMSGFDFDMFNSLDHDLSTDEYELVEFDQPSVDELVNFINGDSSTPNTTGSNGPRPNKNGSTHGDHVGDGVDSQPGSASGAKKKKKKKKKKKTNGRQTSDQGVSVVDGHDDDEADGDDEGDGSTYKSAGVLSPEELQQKMQLARQNPSAVFQESQFEDDEDEELDEQIESFRLALESAHLDSRPKLKPRLQFAPQVVFRNTLVATHRQSAATIS